LLEEENPLPNLVTAFVTEESMPVLQFTAPQPILGTCLSSTSTT
jgi:hypothetical protein